MASLRSSAIVMSIVELGELLGRELPYGSDAGLSGVECERRMEAVHEARKRRAAELGFSSLDVSRAELCKLLGPTWAGYERHTKRTRR